MGNKFNRKHQAIGAWSNPWRRIELDQTGAKVRVMQQDKLIARGRCVYYYVPVGIGVACTCTKNTTDAGDRACVTCHGTKFAPGFQRFLHNTLFWCSAEIASFILSGTQNKTTKKAHVLELTTAATTGTIVTQDKAYTNPNITAWSIRLDAYLRASGNTAAIEYSLNAGGSWTPVALTNFEGSVSGAALGTSGNIRWRITLTRTSVNDLSPAFEIIRIRRVRSEHHNRQILMRRPDYVAGSILILKPQVQDRDDYPALRGKLVDHENQTTLTSPLDFFDTSLTADTPSCVVTSATTGPHSFFEFSSGIQAKTRYSVIDTNYNDQMGIFTQQTLVVRRLQDGEAIQLAY
jgi:hypothetical protein